MIGIHWTYKCTHCFVVYVSQIMPYASNFHNAVSILSQWNWKGKKGETTCKGPSHTESPTKSQSKPPCFLFLSQTPLEDHHCLGHRPELEPAHSTLLRKPRKRCTRRLRLAAADPPTSPSTAPLACSQTNYWPSSSFSTVLTPVCSAWNMRPIWGTPPPPPRCSPTEKPSWPSPPPPGRVTGLCPLGPQWSPCCSTDHTAQLGMVFVRSPPSASSLEKMTLVSFMFAHSSMPRQSLTECKAAVKSDSTRHVPTRDT